MDQAGYSTMIWEIKELIHVIIWFLNRWCVNDDTYSIAEVTTNGESQEDLVKVNGMWKEEFSHIFHFSVTLGVTGNGSDSKF